MVMKYKSAPIGWKYTLLVHYRRSMFKLFNGTIQNRYHKHSEYLNSHATKNRDCHGDHYIGASTSRC